MIGSSDLDIFTATRSGLPTLARMTAMTIFLADPAV